MNQVADPQAAVQAWVDALAGGDPWADREPAATRLANWLDWTDSIALAGALGRQAAASAACAAPSESTGAGIVDAGRQRLLAVLRATVKGGVSEWAVGGPQGRDPADLRRMVTRAQRQMDDGVARLRAAVRDRVAAMGEAGHELAALDAVLEQALAERQRHLLAGAAGRLARLGHNAAGHGALMAALMAPLAAELELRLQPVQGLAQALHPTQDPNS